ncbi:hypothetical protein HUK38_12235 [Thiospirillum jenense]|uniref:Uncharacterized protein n=1 Tax=Thiospirillum jenense TaxID=1653858 RepID=A0A839HDH2_9GAMM|nr:hypothetical protein [Thiospirillum jenense]
MFNLNKLETKLLEESDLKKLSFHEKKIILDYVNGEIDITRADARLYREEREFKRMDKKSSTDSSASETPKKRGLLIFSILTIVLIISSTTELFGIIFLIWLFYTVVRFRNVKIW